MTRTVYTMGEWDAERIAQALSNLIGNSIEHGRLDAPVLIDIAASEETVRVTVHNQGPPIPDALQTLFEIGTHDRKALLEYSGAWGMGLGLFIVRAIVGSHGGTMQLLSDATRGTLFDIALPRTPPPAT